LLVLKLLETKNEDIMLTLNPQYIKDTEGNESLVILPSKEFETLIKELEELEDIKLYDEAKKMDSGERILFSDYVKNRKKRDA
jgi:hypothetical protein